MHTQVNRELSACGFKAIGMQCWLKLHLTGSRNDCHELPSYQTHFHHGPVNLFTITPFVRITTPTTKFFEDASAKLSLPGGFVYTVQRSLAEHLRVCHIENRAKAFGPECAWATYLISRIAANCFRRKLLTPQLDFLSAFDPWKSTKTRSTGIKGVTATRKHKPANTRKKSRKRRASRHWEVAQRYCLIVELGSGGGGGEL
ncbi:hypothetical protein BaRGS_00016489 [Batillaria attramentaria]|uniref:Uncharacterized protein n=1 Tax=Batillaria attramentaria TaxID=370345 RepID=A0ABD0KZK9_9CAEN